MNTSRHLVRAVLGGVAVTWLLLTGATVAWAGPAPLEREPARDLAPASGRGGGGTSAWEIVTVGAASAALAVLVTLLVMYVVLHRRAPHHAAPA
jgi:hypothetical protein